MKSFSFKKSVGIWFVIAACILIVNAAFIYLSFQRFETQKHAVEHTYEVITNLEGAIASLLDVQAAQRGYAITGMQDYLVPYTNALPKVAEYLKMLDELLVDNPKQQERLGLIKDEVNQRLELAAKIIATYQADGQQAAFDMIKSGAGKRQMDEIRSGINEMIAEELRLLSIRQSNVDHASAVTLNAGAAGLAVCIFILALVFWLIRKEMKHRTNAENSLMDTLSETKRISTENMQLSQLADYLQGCQSVDEAYTILSRTLPNFLPGTSGAITLFNNSRNSVKVMETWGDEEISREEYPPDDCWALRRGQIHRVSPNGTEPVCGHVQTHPSGGYVCYPMQAHGETLGIFYVSAKNQASLDDKSTALIRRVSEQTSLAISNLKLRDKLRDQSVRDALTKLFNRRYLEETLEREIARSIRSSQPLCILVLDIDHFKKYNDTWGHDAGDALLVQFAHLLQSKVRKEDIACRYGGEEFVIVLPFTSLEMAEKRAQFLIEETGKMKAKLKNGDKTSVTVSIGVAAFPIHGDSAEDVISMADKALYKAKHEGRNGYRVAG